MTAHADERGSAPIIAMLFGTLSLLAITTMMGRLVVEARAVEDSIADTRAFWAAIGLSEYALSRTAESGGCSSACATAEFVPVQQAYLNQIAFLQPWQYPDVGASYSFFVQAAPSLDPLAPSGHVGDMLIRSTFVPCPAPGAGVTCATGAPMPAPVMALRSLVSARPVEFRFCLAPYGVTTCGSGGTMTVPAKQPYPQFVTSIHRPSS